MIIKTRTEIADFFHANQEYHQQYQKSGLFIARFAEPGETIFTVIAGKMETLTTAGFGKIILRNILVGSTAETYMVDENKFRDRYDILDGQYIFADGHSWQKVRARGQINTFKYIGEDIQFEAPWHELMILHSGDYLACPIGSDPTDIYRIEANAFATTYRLIPES